jgi:hypothetical protein
MRAVRSCGAVWKNMSRFESWVGGILLMSVFCIYVVGAQKHLCVISWCSYFMLKTRFHLWHGAHIT